MPDSPWFEWLITYRYLLIFPLAVAEGPILMVFCGVLWKLGYFSLLPLFLVLAASDLFADVIWYAAGRWGGHRFVRRFGKYFNVNEAMVAKVEARFRAHEGKIIFFSKLTMGLGFAIATILAAGMLRVNFKKFLAINAVGQVFWTGILLMVGYLYGGWYERIDQGFRYVSLAGFLLLAYLAFTGFKQYLRRKTERNEL